MQIIIAGIKVMNAWVDSHKIYQKTYLLNRCNSLVNITDLFLQAKYMYMQVTKIGVVTFINKILHSGCSHVC